MSIYKKLSKESFNEIKIFFGRKLSKCYRHFYESDVDEILFEQIDGDILLVFDDDSKLLFQADSESFSLKYKINPIINEEEFTLISNRKFWENKVNQELTSIELKTSSYRKNPYGVLFHIGDSTLEISYQIEGEHDFDFISIS